MNVNTSHNFFSVDLTDRLIKATAVAVLFKIDRIVFRNDDTLRTQKLCLYLFAAKRKRWCEPSFSIYYSVTGYNDRLGVGV